MEVQRGGISSLLNVVAVSNFGNPGSHQVVRASGALVVLSGDSGVVEVHGQNNLVVLENAQNFRCAISGHGTKFVVAGILAGIAPLLAPEVEEISRDDDVLMSLFTIMCVEAGSSPTPVNFQQFVNQLGTAEPLEFEARAGSQFLQRVMRCCTMKIDSSKQKIEHDLQQEMEETAHLNVVVIFGRGTDEAYETVQGMELHDRTSRVEELMNELKRISNNSQEHCIRLLSTLNSSFYSSWISNRLYLREVATSGLTALSYFDSVREIRPELTVALPDIPNIATTSADPQWGTRKIDVQGAWNLPGGNKGKGTVACSLDSGVFFHEANSQNYRGEHGWFDAVGQSDSPVDLYGHGSHTLGTMVGGMGIGVAPEAEWIACRAFKTDTAFELELVRCGEWVLAPTLPNGDSPNPDMAPDVVNNSWASAGHPLFYDDVVKAWNFAGITPVFAIGNSGPAAASVEYPGYKSEVIGVGATTESDEIAEFSSRGPSIDGTVKPDLAAPGDKIRSAWIISDNSYKELAGTSMACPHVSGTVLLMKAARKGLANSQIKKVLCTSCDQTVSPGDLKWPNEAFGHGRLNTRKAVQAVLDGQF